MGLLGCERFGARTSYGWGSFFYVSVTFGGLAGFFLYAVGVTAFTWHWTGAAIAELVVDTDRGRIAGAYRSRGNFHFYAWYSTRAYRFDWAANSRYYANVDTGSGAVKRANAGDSRIFRNAAGLRTDGVVIYMCSRNF